MKEKGGRQEGERGKRWCWRGKNIIIIADGGASDGQKKDEKWSSWRRGGGFTTAGEAGRGEVIMALASR